MVSDPKFGRQFMLVGAFLALEIPNVQMVEELAALTRTDDEVIKAIRIMRDATPGDRVYPALTWLRAQRMAA